ncbi:MAG: 2-hydroxyacid dehydrogenase [Actinobacteria bacterium]|jgi:phosphoglycerate dehydrogenase-like enzyme|nr:2-hydroxyacid dehydrogenase [Actinomycetota bacterium]
MAEFVVSLPNDEGLAEAVGEVTGVEFVTWNLDGPPPRERIDIVVPPYWGGRKRLAQLAQVETRLVQWQSIGFDGVDRFLPAGTKLANATSVHETSTAELAVGLAIASQRGLADFVRDGLTGTWNLRTFPSLADRRVLIVGYGGVGKAVDARLSGFEARVTRIARTARTEPGLAGNEVEVAGFEGLREALAEAEIVILTVPLTDETRGMIDAGALAAMPDGALLINVARGGVVVTDALVAELQSGRLRAALDVTDPEPLPSDHPIWQCPNALITPHAGGDSTAMLPRMAALIQRQIDHLRKGEAPENLVLGG